MKKKNHIHSGYTSEGTFDPIKAFEEMGLKKGEQIIDAGCGTGYMSMVASRIVGSGGRIISLDIHEPAIDILQKRIEFGSFKNITAKVHDITEKLDMDIGRSDLILLTNVFHGFLLNSETDQVLSFIHENLKDDGRISIIEVRKDASNTGPPPEERFGPDDMEYILKSYGFVRDKDLVLSDSHYLIILSKK